MKLLHVIASTNPATGGAAEGTMQHSRALSAAGHEVEIACLDSPSEPWLDNLPVKTYALGPGASQYQYSRKLIPWLRSHHAEYDAIILHGLWQYCSFGAWLVLHRATTPYLVYPHGMLDPWFKYAYPLKHLKKRVYWRLAESRVLRDAAAVCFTCEEEMLLARESFRRYKCNEVVVGYGISEPMGDPQEQSTLFLEQFPELKTKRLLLFMGRVHPKKGCDLLIEAFSKIAVTDPALHLVIAGPDQSGSRASLQAMAERLGVAGRITWTGMLTHNVKWGAFRSSEVFVLPSHQENFGIAIVEALACRLPVLISNKVNIWREIESDGAGFVSDDTMEGTLLLMQKWVSLLSNEKAAMRANARNTFLQRFEIRQAAQNLLNTIPMMDVKAQGNE